MRWALRSIVGACVAIAAAAWSPVGHGGVAAVSAQTTWSGAARLAPDCDVVRAALTLDDNGLPPYPGNDTHPAIDGVALYAVVGDDRTVGSGAYSPWLRQWMMGAVEPKASDLRRRIGAAGVANVCVQTFASVPEPSIVVRKQPKSGIGWRLISTGADAGGSALSIAGDAVGAKRLYTQFATPIRERRLVDFSRSLLVGYTTINSSCGGEGPRFVGWGVDARLHIVDPQFAAGPPPPNQVADSNGLIACPAVFRSNSYIVAASRNLFPRAKVIFRNCTLAPDIRCLSHIVVDLSAPLSLASMTAQAVESNVPQ